nr:hypothetical protein [Aneurinibacillus terranovensis]
MRSAAKKLEDAVSKHTTPSIAAKVNPIIDTIERLTETAVQDANSRVVIGLKQHNLFTPETAEAIKQAVIEDVLKNLGPLKDEAAQLLGPIEGIVAQMVEKYVLRGKDQVNQLVGTPVVQTAVTDVAPTAYVPAAPTTDTTAPAQETAQSQSIPSVPTP